jgi:putative intracellular protease/amidase
MGSLVVEDRELLTGQDPYSAKALGSSLVAKIRRSTP